MYDVRRRIADLAKEPFGVHVARDEIHFHTMHRMPVHRARTRSYLSQVQEFAKSLIVQRISRLFARLRARPRALLRAAAGLGRRFVLLMRRIDELHLSRPFLGSRRLRYLLQIEGFPVSRKRSCAKWAFRRCTETQDRHPRRGPASNLPVSTLDIDTPIKSGTLTSTIQMGQLSIRL